MSRAAMLPPPAPPAVSRRPLGLHSERVWGIERRVHFRHDRVRGSFIARLAAHLRGDRGAIVGDRRQESPDATSSITRAADLSFLTTHYGVWMRIRIRNRGIPRGCARKGVRYLLTSNALVAESRRNGGVLGNR